MRRETWQNRLAAYVGLYVGSRSRPTYWLIYVNSQLTIRVDRSCDTLAYAHGCTSRYLFVPQSAPTYRLGQARCSPISTCFTKVFWLSCSQNRAQVGIGVARPTATATYLLVIAQVYSTRIANRFFFNVPPFLSAATLPALLFSTNNRSK